MRKRSAQNIEILAGDDLQGGFGQGGSRVTDDHIDGGFPIEADFRDALLVGQMTFVAAVFPAGEIHFGDGVRKRRIAVL